MRLFNRMALLVKADAHGVMDHLEERTLLLKQHLREAELELTCKRARIEALEDEDRRLNKEVDRRRARVAALDQDVELALARGEEALARFSLRRLLPQREALQELRTRLAEIAAHSTRLCERLEAQEVELDELRGRVRARLAAAEREESSSVACEAGVADEEIELELLRRRAPAGAAATEGGS
ncbi:MAG: PspA/IM30 family protein [Myxococcota bacterium]